ncbi:MAG: HAD family phosphatase [Thermoproteota archaeon]|nr:HAD family phosphatase [Thermoproteota archaeon]
MTKLLKAVVFDVDGTLTEVESSWQFLHQQLGTWDRGKQYAEQFSQGVISYEKWAQLDASLWSGVSIETVQEIICRIPYMKGVKDVLATLKKEGLKTILLSAGLSLLTERIKREIEVDDCLANELVVKDGFLTGEVEVNVSVLNKDITLHRILQKMDVAMFECAAVGDDETMIPLFKRVSLGIAFNPCKNLVEQCADVVVKGDDIRGVLPYLLHRQKGK